MFRYEYKITFMSVKNWYEFEQSSTYTRNNFLSILKIIVREIHSYFEDMSTRDKQFLNWIKHVILYGKSILKHSLKRCAQKILLFFVYFWFLSTKHLL